MGLEIPTYRPPSEAYSLLIRATRNCPWNKCAFCGMYKGDRFQRRTVEEIKADVDTLKGLRESVLEISARLGFEGKVNHQVRVEVWRQKGVDIAHYPWVMQGPRTAFIADSNSLVMPTAELAEVIRYLRDSFPSLERVTSYARSKTILKKSVEELIELREAGLNRLHVGLESGDDVVLWRMQKGATADEMIRAGLMVKEAGITLSEYVLMGLGGRERWQEHAVETARVLNAIDPHFIRIRTLMVQPGSQLAEMQERGEFELPSPVEFVQEEYLMIKNLEVTSEFVSDHVTNYMKLNGKMPAAKAEMLKQMGEVLEMAVQDPEAAERLLDRGSLEHL
ncbi:MAG: radical SAM protein [Bacillota bacterium]